MLDRTTIDRIIELGVTAVPIHEDHFNHYYAFNGQIHEIRKDTAFRHHTFKSLDDFADYLNSGRSGEGPGLIFVGDKEIVADLDYMADLRQTATLPLEYSEEYEAIQTLSQGMTRKALWRRLLTALDDCMDAALLLQIGNMSLKLESHAHIAMERAGWERRSSKRSLSVTVEDPESQGTEKAEIQTDWAWTGRIWEAYNRTFTLDLVMEIEPDDEPRFIFHPRRLKAFLREARLQLVRDLGSKLNGDRFAVYEGEF